MLAGYKINAENCRLVELIPPFLKNRVILLGHQDQHKLADLYSVIDIYFLTSLSEAFPNSLLEALSCSSVTLSVNAGDSFFLQPDSHYKLYHFDVSKGSQLLMRSFLDSRNSRLWESLRFAARYRAQTIQTLYSGI